LTLSTYSFILKITKKILYTTLEETRMTVGTVKWFNNAKGYGFATPEDNADQDVFIHFSSIEMDGYRTLREGQRISFDIEQGEKGLHGANIKILD